MDKATIVSIFPYEIFQRHVKMMPSATRIPACEDENLPVCHVLGSYSYDRYVLDGKSIRVPVTAFNQANGIVRTFKKSIFYGHRSEGRIPGVEVFDGEISTARFIKEYADKHAEMIESQLKWYNALIELADNDWSIKEDKRFITRLQVDAARRLKLDKPWAKDAVSERRTQCTFCYGHIHPEAAICIHCKNIVNIEKYNAMMGGEIDKPINIPSQPSLAEMKMLAQANKLQREANQ